MTQLSTSLKRRTKFYLVLGLTLGIFVFPVNLLYAQLVVNPNGSFESSAVTVGDDTSGVEGWTLLKGNNYARMTVVDDTVLDGNRALRVAIDSVGGNSWDLQIVNETFPIEPGLEYKYSVQILCAPDSGTAALTVGNPSYAERMRITIDNALSGNWKKYEGTFTFPTDDIVGRAPIHLSFDDNVGKVIYFDDLRITKPTVNPNGSFEMSPVTVGDDTSSVEGWAFNENTAQGADVNWKIVDDPVKDGDRALSIAINAIGTSRWHIEALNAFVNVIPGESYRYYASVRASESGASAHFTVGNLDFNEYLRIERNQQLTTEWQRISGTFTVPAGDTNICRAPIHFNFTENIGKTIYLDSVVIYQISGLAPYDSPIAEGKEKFLGNVYSGAQLLDFTAYWNQVTPENAGKWGSVEPANDSWNWGTLDAAYDFAKSNGYPFRFHVLIWGNQQPTWIESLSPAEQLVEITQWFDSVGTRYPDIEYVEVVNEPIHDPPSGEGNGNYIEALGGTGTTGWDWVINAFTLARQYFPNSELMINEYGISGSVSNTATYLEIIRLLQAQNLIDGIGLQAHAFSTTGDMAITKQNLDSLATTGLPIQATEMDIDGLDDAVQLADYQRIFPTFWEHPSVIGVTLWGWRPGMWRTQYGAYLIAESGIERPSAVWLRAYVDTAEIITGIDIDKDALPISFHVYNNYPNPFNPSTQIIFDLPKTSEVTIKIYNVLGQLIQTMNLGNKKPGRHIATFHASNLPSGVYFYQLKAGSNSAIKRMLLLK